jgi:hypothetical protein
MSCEYWVACFLYATMISVGLSRWWSGWQKIPKKDKKSSNFLSLSIEGSHEPAGTLSTFLDRYSQRVSCVPTVHVSAHSMRQEACEIIKLTITISQSWSSFFWRVNLCWPRCRNTEISKIIRGTQTAFAEKLWLHTWAHELTKTRRSLASLPPFCIGLCSNQFSLQSLYNHLGQIWQYLYDNELKPPGAAMLPVRTIIPGTLSNRNQITPSRW